ncbi:putative 1,3-propanediol dehydrogenase [Alteracholeplasma palmae J233]|uniref:Putative 1,3-propanediol dehydrogenase n=1 Tax=Alteracholeplasma palmae (strain ATCC 49389 / J233) TaxID=1318466 RepID=U4KR17_ALTPJ|nr:iron-containing alcohol dehydrogenase [Alteracholeplasma palmae]CCV63786.1 putative 1,3-propanediol dehydrogenase [Alteracholeplasma palmae J233]
MKKLIYRIYQKILYVGTFFLNFKEPLLLKGTKSLEKISDILGDRNINSVLLVTDANLVKLGLLNHLKEILESSNIKYSIYDETQPNPTIYQVDDAYKVYNDNNCQAVISVGGGSVIDLGKMVLVKAAYPKKSITKFKGILKIHRKLPFHIAIPTTVGTGSEATLAAVVSNPDTHEKYAIMDTHLIPDVAILSNEFVRNLPRNLIVETSMDALTHAIEAYIGKSNTKKTKKYALEAIKLILDNVESAYEKDEKSIEALHYASYLAGVSFTRAYVGNVHAIAHTLGGFYNVPHGLANAIILPHVLSYYGNKINEKIRSIEEYTNRKDLIQHIFMLNKKFNIPENLNGLIKEEDIVVMIKRALKEANPLYPVPVIFNDKDFLNIYHKIN